MSLSRDWVKRRPADAKRLAFTGLQRSYRAVTLSGLFAQGGPVMVVLLAMSVVAAAIVLLKSWQLLRLRRGQARLVQRILSNLDGSSTGQALAELGSIRHPLARVLETSLALVSEQRLDAEAVRAEIARVGSAELRKLETWLRGLSAIAHLSPLLGLLGTVFGMISAFMKVEAAGSQVNPALLSGGIWQALLTTAFGLTIAIPSMAAFYLFEGEVDRLRAAMKDTSVRVMLRYSVADQSAANTAYIHRLQQKDSGIMRAGPATGVAGSFRGKLG